MYLVAINIFFSLSDKDKKRVMCVLSKIVGKCLLCIYIGLNLYVTFSNQGILVICIKVENSIYYLVWQFCF